MPTPWLIGFFARFLYVTDMVRVPQYRNCIMVARTCCMAKVPLLAAAHAARPPLQKRTHLLARGGPLVPRREPLPRG